MLLRICFVLRGLTPDSWSFPCNHKTRSADENNVLQQQLSAQIQQGELSTIKRLSRHEHVALLIAFTPDPISWTTGLIQEYVRSFSDGITTARHQEDNPTMKRLYRYKHITGILEQTFCRRNPVHQTYIV